MNPISTYLVLPICRVDQGCGSAPERFMHVSVYFGVLGWLGGGLSRDGAGFGHSPDVKYGEVFQPCDTPPPISRTANEMVPGWLMPMQEHFKRFRVFMEWCD